MTALFLFEAKFIELPYCIVVTIKSVMLGIMHGKGRPNREWIDDIKKRCKKDLFSLTIIFTRPKIVETNDEICDVHLRAVIPWTTMTMMIVVTKHTKFAVYWRGREAGKKRGVRRDGRVAGSQLLRGTKLRRLFRVHGW